jgi:NADH-quinone oxidoreductase subunit J
VNWIVKRLMNWTGAGVLFGLLSPTLATGQSTTPGPVTTPATDFIFYVLALITLVMAVMVVARRNPLQGALALVLSFFCLGGVYVLLFAHLLAAMQVLVYAGAIMVLFVFVIMLLNLSDRELGAPRATVIKGAALGAFAFLVVMTLVSANLHILGLEKILLPDGSIGEAQFLAPPLANPNLSHPGALPANYGSVAGIGTSLYSHFLLPFELVSVLLLVAIVGAVAIAKKRI